MKILLIGGGSGGHITPLLAVAHELKKSQPDVSIVAVCERGSKFASLFSDSEYIDELRQISAGKYRRYAGLTAWQRLFDIKTLLLNIRDAFRTLRGYRQARRLIKQEKPNIMLIKGGFVAVPMGLAASRQGVAFVTHDSDSTPGMANRIISKWAVKHATGMPAELYSYPENKTIYTGIPVSDDFSSVSSQQVEQLRDSHGLGNCKKVITVIGGSQGGLRLNQDFIAISKELMKDDSLGIIHIAGQAHETATKESYESFLEEAQLKRVVVRGFVKDLARYTGAADVVVSRAGANAIAELSLQKKAVILVPGKLADGHQNKNADYLEQKQAVRQVASDDPQALLQTIRELLDDPEARNQLASKLHELSKPTAAQELANLTLEQAK